MTQKLVAEQELYHALQDLVDWLGDAAQDASVPSRYLKRANKALTEYERVNREPLPEKLKVSSMLRINISPSRPVKKYRSTRFPGSGVSKDVTSYYECNMCLKACDLGPTGSSCCGWTCRLVSKED